MSTETEVIRVVAEILEISDREIRLSDHFVDDLGANSLDIVNLVWRVEEVFALGEIAEASLEKIATVGDLVALIEPLRSHEPSEASESFDVALASDHAGVGLKSELIRWLKARDYSVLDLGPTESHPVDYPDFAELLGRKIALEEARFGVLTCGSGIGMSIAANKVRGLRAAMVSEPVSAALARQHNDANVLCMGSRMIGPEMAFSCLQAFLNTAFEPGDDGRHQRRVHRIAEIEKNENNR
ncbi:MAG: ribose 5-phosphate isomerase B [Bradymonadaceae bacterium]|nr:ribose 5-phosphate isomerase B [Lujinxingiaceae bacterium]